MRNVLPHQAAGWAIDRMRADLGPFGAPVVVLGMHRSGTSVVTRILRAAGGYFGATLDPNSEAISIQRINDHVLRAVGSSWFLPPATDANAAIAIRGAELILANRGVLWRTFFEPFGTAGYEHEGRPGEPARDWVSLSDLLPRSPWPARPAHPDGVPFWGFKDPRATYTLPAWLRFLPGLRVLHVVRSGGPVALSLSERAVRSGEGAPRCEDPLYAVDLWSRYVTTARTYAQLGADRYFELSYERLVAEPAGQLARLGRWLDVPIDATKLAEIVKAPTVRTVPAETQRAVDQTAIV